MDAATVSPNRNVRPLVAQDLERLIAIDCAHTGRARRRYFEKHFAAAEAHPEDVVKIGVDQNGSLRGFAIARILRGEFGHEQVVAVLDSLAVEPESREHGVGHALMSELIEIFGRRGVQSIHTEASWKDRNLLGFFAATGFELAPRLVLERSLAAPLDEKTDEV
jgi:ribosomal protein S18 acetylase RimI-like enzyme